MSPEKHHPKKGLHNRPCNHHQLNVLRLHFVQLFTKLFIVYTSRLVVVEDFKEAVDVSSAHVDCPHRFVECWQVIEAVQQLFLRKIPRLILIQLLTHLEQVVLGTFKLLLPLLQNETSVICVSLLRLVNYNREDEIHEAELDGDKHGNKKHSCPRVRLDDGKGHHAPTVTSNDLLRK